MTTTFDEKLGFVTAHNKRIYTFIMDLIPNDWKYLLRIKTFKKSLLKNFLFTLLQQLRHYESKRLPKTF